VGCKKTKHRASKSEQCRKKKHLFKILRDFRLPQRCKCDLHSSGVLRSVKWQFFTDVTGQPIGPIFKGQEVPEEFFFDILTFGNGADRLSKNVGTELLLYTA
jgi:hypothetical protein